MTYPPKPGISVYIAAHADDWQLFMQPNAYHDLINPEKKTVFITLTAGDAGFEQEFSLAREEGMKSSIRFCLGSFQDVNERIAAITFGEKKITCWMANQVSAYFLRLPDGGLNGRGFEKYRYQSLEKFYSGNNDTISAIDGSSHYTAWQELAFTLRAILEYETINTENSRIHYQDPDHLKNPGDHPDHIASGKLVQAIPTIEMYDQVLYVGYHCSAESPSLNEEEAFWKTGIFAAYESTVFEHHRYSTLREDRDLYQKYCGRRSVTRIVKKQEQNCSRVYGCLPR